MSTVTVSRMSERAQYDNTNQLEEFMAKKLKAGSLALVMGAGASMGFGLPSWDELIARLYAAVGKSPPPGKSELQSERFLVDHCSGDRMVLATRVKEALYQGFATDLPRLRTNDLLSAVGALTMASGRGNVAKVITFNYDDILEVYLSCYGFHCASVSHVPRWATREDVTILHPHGILRSEKGAPVRGPIVFTQLDYDEIVGDAKNVWRSTLMEILRSHFCLFIGLSGTDQNLTNMLHEVHKEHASASSGDVFWGARYALVADSMNGTWETRGVFPVEVDSYAAIPAALLRICQKAAASRRDE